MLPTEDDCDACTLKPSRGKLMRLLFASLPFILTFAVVAIAVRVKLFPLLSGINSPAEDERDEKLPVSNADIGAGSKKRGGKKFTLTAKGLAGAVFSTNLALSAVLVELLLCEISNTLDPRARSAALQTTLPLLIFLLIIATPALEIHSVVLSSGYTLAGGKKGKRRVGWALQLSAFSAWLVSFWYLGRGLLGQYLHEASYEQEHGFTEGCLERIGVIGIALMASLAGFAAVSAIWQSFGSKVKSVTDTDISRKKAGLEATNAMLEVKRSRLRALQRRLSETPAPGLMTKAMNTLRGGTSETQERSALALEISGLETMASTLSASLYSLQSRRTTQARAHTSFGRFLILTSYIFSVYCIYRLVATTLALLRRLISTPHSTFSTTDPVNRILSLLANHWDPKLDHAAWSRQISFLLSGVMLLFSISAVLQTFHLLTRLLPRAVFAQAQANVALIVSQVTAMYVISSALLLRSNLPREVSSVVSEALGQPLEMGFVERWFEGWFLGAASATMIGIWVGRKVRSAWDDEDDFGGGDGEGKMS